MPRMGQSTVSVGEMAGPYQFRRQAPHLFHARSVTWINREVPRDSLSPDLQKSMNTPGTIHRPGGADAEARLQAVAETGQDSGLGGLAGSDPRWGEFIRFAQEFVDSGEWESDAIDSTVATGRKLTEARESELDFKQ